MGFSVSGSMAVIIVATLIAASTVYAAGSQGFERLDEAREDRNDRELLRENTEITVANVTYDAGTTTLTVTVNNTGTTALTVADTDLLVDNTYITNATTRVEGDTGAKLWVPGEQLEYEVDLPNEPTAVTVITEAGIADREGL